MTAHVPIEIPVRRLRRVACLSGFAVSAAVVVYIAVLSGQEALHGPARVAFHLGAVCLVSFGVGTIRLYYGILTGRSKLTITQQGVTLGDHHLAWTDIQSIAHRPRSRAVRLQAHQRLRHIDLTHDHVKDLAAFAAWLQEEHRIRSSGG